MPITHELHHLIRSGFQRIGELLIQTDVLSHPFIICHHEDSEHSKEPSFGGLKLHNGPAEARDISTYAEEGSYRFTKGQTNLKRGWVMALKDGDELRQALDQFYPAAVGLFLALRDGTLEIENLRQKLNRQTGMYRFARSISDAGAQELVRQVCGPAHQCAKRILWQIDEHTPLDDSEASRYNGIPDGQTETETIPLLCREACNHFVSECRRVAKEESSKPS
jgi:sirohydrochlorin cobaltochelatase